MVDELDLTEERMEFDTDVSVQRVVKDAKNFNPGHEGDCGLCGEHFSRVIEVQHNGNTIDACGRCRDRYGIK